MTRLQQTINLVNISRYANGAPAAFIDTIDAVAASFRSMGYNLISSNNKIYNHALNIIWGVGSPFSPSYAEMQKCFTPNNCVIFNMEQLESSSALVTEEYKEFISRFVVFDYNHKNELYLKQTRNAAIFEFPIKPSAAFSRDFEPKDGFKKNHLVGFYGAPTPRRLAILADLDGEGLNVKRILGKYGPELSKELSECSAVLNIHAYENSSLFEVARCLRPVAMGTPIISEKSDMPKTFEWGEAGIRFTDYGDLKKTISELRSNPTIVHSLTQEQMRFMNKPVDESQIHNLMKNVYVELSQ